MNAGKFERERERIEREGYRRGKRWLKRAMQHLLEDCGATPIKSGNRVIAHRMEEGHAVCVKRRFKTEAQADHVLMQISLEPEPRKKPIRAYYCYCCCGWHLTSENRYASTD